MISFTQLKLLHSTFFCVAITSLALLQAEPLMTSTTTSSFLTPISKDKHTLQYTTTLPLRTPPVPTTLLVDVGASFSWVDCQNNYSSSTYRHTPCNSSLCASLNSRVCSYCYTSPAPDCGNFSCALFPENPVLPNVTLSDALIDSLSVPTTDGSSPGPVQPVPDFVLSCSKTYLLKGFAEGVTGLLALGRANYSFPGQLARDFSKPWVFALCLPASPATPGPGFYGSYGPYRFGPGVDLSKSLVYTPLILNPFTDTIITYALQASDQYFIGVTGVKVNGESVPVNTTLLAIDRTSMIGGTKISTARPYTVLERSIYKAITGAFVSALNKTLADNPVKPLKICYPAEDIQSGPSGPAVPVIDLLLQEEDVFWRIHGANSMVRIRKNRKVDMWCLGFVDGGVGPRESIVIGGRQMEDNLLQFDLQMNRFGFSSSVLSYGTSCASFNFTGLS